MKKTKKEFREYLNREYPAEVERYNVKEQYGSRTRAYGDYLYNQDRIKFNINYQEWLTK